MTGEPVGEVMGSGQGGTVKPAQRLLEQLDDAQGKFAALLGQLPELRRSGVVRVNRQEEGRAGMTSRREILEYVNRADESEQLEPRIQVQRGQGTQLRLRAHLRRGGDGERPAPLDLAYADMQALVDQGHLAYHEPWLTITPAGKAKLRQL